MSLTGESGLLLPCPLLVLGSELAVPSLSLLPGQSPVRCTKGCISHFKNEALQLFQSPRLPSAGLRYGKRHQGSCPTERTVARQSRREQKWEGFYEVYKFCIFMYLIIEKKKRMPKLRECS